MSGQQQPNRTCTTGTGSFENDIVDERSLLPIRRHSMLVPAGCERRPRNHVLVIDASQSMTEADWPPCRLAAAMAASNAYVARLARESPDSMVAVVCFSEKARVVCPWTRVSSLRDVDNLQDEWLKACYAFGLGDTAIGDGLQEALFLVLASKGPAQAVLLTDGHHNTGVDPKEIAPRLRTLATLVIVGIGGSPADVDEPLLRAIASAEEFGRPCYRWIGDEVGLLRHFHALAGRLARE